MIPRDYQEKQIQTRLAKEIEGARTEVKASFGRADIVTPSEVIEIKDWTFWKFGLGQLIAYSVTFPSKKLRLHCFGYIDTPTKHAVIRLFALLPLDITLTWE
jgi:hypothetical protein